MNKLIYPTLLQVGNTIDSHSWFNIIKRNGKKRKKKKREFKYNYIQTNKIILYPTNKQKYILNIWLNECVHLYNLANKYIKDNIKIKKDLNFIKIRKIMEFEIKNICSNNKLPKHVADYSIKHCVEMYKSGLSNKKEFNKFTIKNLKTDRRKKNMVIENSAVSKKKNSIFISILGEIKSSLPLSTIQQNSILQYDKIKKIYYIISPITTNKEKTIEHYEKCGIDIGVRTFMTVYSPEESLEIGSNTNNVIDDINNRLDSIKSSKANNNITMKKYKKIHIKYTDKLRNKINDLHNKSARYLLERFDTILIGKVSTKSMISNLKGNLRKIVKRRLIGLSHYRFRMKLISMSNKFGSEIKLINEYRTTKKCCNCNNIKNNVGSNKIYKCDMCPLILDRDINASINIYKLC